jgi:tetratricopeptide (TPR) repeat protein
MISGSAVFCRGKKLFSPLLAAVVFFAAAAVPLEARGTRDPVLQEADGLIENKRYDDAIQTLTEYIKINPDKFGDAQKRLQRIVKLREQYNTIADDLLDVLVNDPDNNERIVDLTDKLTSIEPASNPSTQRFLNQVRSLAAFNLNRKRLDSIMEQGRVLLAQGDYGGALRVYASGLDIYQADFFDSGFGEDLEEAARAGIDTLERELNEFGPIAERLDSASQGLSGLPEDAALELVNESYREFASIAAELTRVFGSIIGVGNSFEENLAVLQGMDESIGDQSFLAFAGRLIRGPAGRNEGMIGVLDRYWQDRAGRGESYAASLAEKNYNVVKNAMTVESYGQFSLIDQTRGYLDMLINMDNIWLDFYRPAGMPETTIFDRPVLVLKAPDVLKHESMDRSLAFMRILDDIGGRSAALIDRGFPALDNYRQGIINAAGAVSEELVNRRNFNALVSEVSALEDAVRNGGVSYALDSRPPEPASYLRDTLSLAEALNEKLKGQEFNAIVRRYTISNEDLSGEVNARETEFAEANRMLQGINRESGGTVFLAHYPAESLAAFTGMSLKAQVNLSSGRELLDFYAAESPDLITSGVSARNVAPLYSEARRLVSRLEDLQSRSGALSADARTQIARADALRLEGDRLVQESRAALGRNNFDIARDRLDRATGRYHESLNIQESASLRSSWDTRLLELGADIVRIENEIVVRDVRALVTNARNNYYAGNLEQAEDQLVRAQNRWNTTNSTADQEVLYWLGLVRGALSLQSQRTIPATAPLYAEMSQLLSDAKKNYEEGVRLSQNNQRQSALSSFDKARQKTREVRLMFPMNKEARLLDLRIEQRIDLPAFNAAFRSRLNEAVAGTKPERRSPESFADLQDLVEINPAYPRIRELLSQAEIDMGYRPPPPDPRALAESARLTREAQAILNLRDQAQYALALTRLDRALELNPNNDDAMIAKDVVLTRMTGTGIIVLDYDSQREYDRAVQAYIQGNYLTANAIVRQLLQNPRNRNSTLILELQRRIQLVLQ